ncbi:galactoside-binding lectin [Ancylostoma caninum]|uniref:Galectin n=1 Tax=Ancylostoma caninum TaxID=29170 RepID=A0A368FQP3_ANCCA|nr:galactoside-binding lectin [Ancylostoma caninum]
MDPNDVGSFRFNVNLLKKNGDIALHFNPRFDEKAKGFICGKIKPGCVIRNSLVNGEWGNEEREGKNPFERGVGFDLEIKNEEYAFQVSVAPAYTAEDVGVGKWPTGCF